MPPIRRALRPPTGWTTLSIRTIVLAGIATSIGVESTARVAWELGYDIVFAEDATGGPDAAMHANSFEKVFPRIGRIRMTADVLAALK